MDFINDDIMQYAESHSQEESELLKELQRETHQKVLQPRMISGHLQGRFLSLISQLIRPEKILEVGTYTGYATLCLAEGLKKNGAIHTIEINEELFDFQKKYFNKSNYKNQIFSHQGDAKKIISELDLNFDLVFIDADKSNYSHYFDLILPKLNKGGVIIADNVLWSGKVLHNDIPEKDSETLGLKNFNDKVKADKAIETLLLPIRDGLMICRKI
ncbi:MAG: O-methyltransferase [Flavobacteriaceae bacterium TMED42]|nr:MAG: O-methyltransferase [Flavobacteriaceae bacterium TMED42]|tara:strand:- start:57 stop:701 length:645 start_codon:yes stop_codon:yes gene_type:complete